MSSKLKHKCISCGTEIDYGSKGEVFCSECGIKNYDYLTSIAGVSIQDKIDSRLRSLFDDEPGYLYFLMDNYNGVGAMYRSVTKLSTRGIKSSYWSSEDEDVTINFSSETFSITKTMTKKGLGRIDIHTGKISYCTMALKDLMKTRPTDGLNMHLSEDAINKNTKHRLLNDAVGLYFKETTEEIYEEYMEHKRKIVEVLEFIQPAEKQILPRG